MVYRTTYGMPRWPENRVDAWFRVVKFAPAPDTIVHRTVSRAVGVFPIREISVSHVGKGLICAVCAPWLLRLKGTQALLQLPPALARTQMVAWLRACKK